MSRGALLLMIAMTGGCHWFVGITPCFDGQRCPDGLVCNGSVGVCSAIAICGDGVAEGTESCDDGNGVSGDGCSSTCREDTTQLDRVSDEPLNAETIETRPLVIEADMGTYVDGDGGERSEASSLWLTAAQEQVVRIETFNLLDSDDCAPAETAVYVDMHSRDFNAQTSRGSYSTRGSGNGIGAACGVLTTLLPGGGRDGDRLVLTGEITQTTAIGRYRIQIAPIEMRGEEREPNDDVAHADAAAADGLDVAAKGTLSSAEDVDFYSVVVPGGRGLRVEVVPATRSTSCDAFNANVAVVDSDGVQQIAKQSRDGACPTIDATGSDESARVAETLAARNLSDAVETFYVAVSLGNTPFIGALPYHVVLTVR